VFPSSPAFALLARLGVLPTLGERPPVRGAHGRRLPVAGHPDVAIEYLSLPGRAMLFEAGEPVHALHIVLQGALKTVAHEGTGTERVTSFVHRGEVIGIEQRADGGHAAEAVTLEPSIVLGLPIAGLERLCAGDPTLWRLWWRTCAEPMDRHAAQLVLLARRTVHERLERFLWSLVHMPSVMGDSSHRLHLPMGRGEIASYLGMTNESVSRAFAKLADDGRIRVRGRHIDLPFRSDTLPGLARRPDAQRA